MTYTELMCWPHGIAAFLGGCAAWGLRGAFMRWQDRRLIRRHQAEANARACARMAAECAARPEFLQPNHLEEKC